MADKCEEKLITKSAELNGDDEISFDLHVYMNDSFWGNENQPVVLYLFDGPFDADKLTNLSHPWVQFAKESKAKVYGVELRGKGESQIEDHTPSSNPELFTIKHHMDDLFMVFETTNYEFGPQPWLIVGSKRAAELAIWNRLMEKEVFKCVYAIDPDLGNLKELDGKLFETFNPTNIIFGASTDVKLNECQKFVDKLDAANVIALRDSDHKQIVAQIKSIVLSD